MQSRKDVEGLLFIIKRFVSSLPQMPDDFSCVVNCFSLFPLCIVGLLSKIFGSYAFLVSELCLNSNVLLSDFSTGAPIFVNSI
jgi:hypothetical protein